MLHVHTVAYNYCALRPPFKMRAVHEYDHEWPSAALFQYVQSHFEAMAMSCTCSSHAAVSVQNIPKCSLAPDVRLEIALFLKAQAIFILADGLLEVYI